ncbi:MAG: DUF3047 domain-containing protein [Victivallaceae bacterium]
MNKIILLFLAVGLSCCVFAESERKNWCEHFNPAVDGKEGGLPSGWEVKATVWGVKKTAFEIESGKEEDLVSSKIIGMLKVFADEATGALFCEPYKTVDLTKTPVLRWRWRVNAFPKGADGRNRSKDDQAIVIYVGANDWMFKKSIAYRWETDTPVGCEGSSRYAGGTVIVKWFCLRNQQSGKNKWIIEERNIADDFKKAFGFIPKEFVLSIGANSQNTKSESLAFVDFIEFLPLNNNGELEIAQVSATADSSRKQQ